MSLINEGRIGEDKTDLERIVLGFSLLSEIVDVFVSFFSTSELKQIHDGAKNALVVSDRNIKEYFEDKELSNLVTQLRAYSSLIVLKVEGHIGNTGATLEAKDLKKQHPLAKFVGILSNSEAERLKQTITTNCRQVDLNEW
jgi:hypothetical protein